MLLPIPIFFIIVWIRCLKTELACAFVRDRTRAGSVPWKADFRILFRIFEDGGILLKFLFLIESVDHKIVFLETFSFDALFSHEFFGQFDLFIQK